MPGAAGASCPRCLATASVPSGGGVGSREEILARLRSASPPARELPDARRFGERATDLHARFAQALKDAGGLCVPLPSAEALPAALEQLAPYRDGRGIASLLPGLRRTTD